MLRNVLIIGEREDQAGVLLHVQQQVVQVEHQQLYALLAVREGCVHENRCKCGFIRTLEFHLNGVYASISPSFVNSLRR